MHEGRVPQPGVPSGPRNTRKGRRKKEVAGPYRSQSSNPKIHGAATKHEHRKVPTAPPDAFSVPDITTYTPPRKSGAQKARAESRRAMRKARRILADAGSTISETSDPVGHYQRAKYLGISPPAALQRTYPKAYAKAERAAHEFRSKREGLKEDPLAEFVISTAATAGLGGVAGLAGKVGAEGLSAAGAKLASTEATVAEKAVESEAKGIVARTASKAGSAAKAGAERVRTAPMRVGRRIKAAPGKVKAAPGRVKQAVTTSEGRQAAKQAELRRIGAAGRRARRKPVRYTGAGYAAAPPLGADNTDLGHRANALAAGTAEALYQNPIGTGKATGRGVIGAVAAPIALGASAADSAITGNPAPLVNTATEQFEGAKELGGKLLSGEPEKVRKTVEEDVGLSYLAPLPAIGRLKVYRDARGRFRSVAQDVRRGAAEKTGSRRIRVAPKGVESHVFGPMENRAARRRVARRVTRTTNPPRVEAGYFQKQILRNLKKAPVSRSLRNVHGMEAGDLLQTLAEYGIRTPADVKFVRKHGPAGEVPKEGMVTLTAALDFAEKHPKILTDKHFNKALDTYIVSSEHLPAALAGKGRRAKAMAQGDMFGITRPEDRVPMAAREFTTAKTRAAAWQQALKREKAIQRDRREGRKLADQAQVATGAERVRLKAEASSYYRHARIAESRNAALVKALGKYSRPGQALSSSARRKFYDEPLLREYESEVAAAAKEAGLAAPAWTHHAKFREAGEVAPAYPTAAARVQHMRSGKLAAEDRVDRSLRALLSGSVVGPRLRAGGQELARHFTHEEMLPVKVNGKTQHLVTQDQWATAVGEKQYDPRHYVLFPARQFKQAMLDPFKSQAELATMASAALEKGLRADTPGNKYVVVRREAAKEFAAQISPQHWAGEELVNKVSKGASRWLLFSPAWMMIQSVAEAVPMAIAHPELVNPAKLIQLEGRLRKNAKLNPTEAKAFAAVAGEAPTSLHTPDAFRPELDSNPHGIFSDGARALTKSRLGQGTFSLIRLRPFGVFDNWRQGKYRELLLAAEADKQLNGWWAGLKGALHIQKRISDELRHLPKHEQLAALTKPKYRKQLDEMANYVENILGNWQSFTRFERSFAPFLVFYPFIRYSLRWPLTFAKQHPVSATIAAFLGQQNAEQLDKILGHAPANPLAYALPVWQDAEGNSHILPAGQRAAPGLSAPTQAVASGQPSQALSIFNPLIGAGITAATGVNAYTGRQDGERGKQAVNLLLATSPIARFFDLQIAEPESIAGKRFQQIDRNKRKRSLYTPWESISARQFKETEGFSADLGSKYSDPVASVWDNPEIGEAIFGGKNGKEVDWKLLRKLLREHKISEAAAKRVLNQEEPFFPDQESGGFGPERQKAMELLTGGIFIPTEKKRKAKRITNGIGGRSVGGAIGGSTGGPIGGRPIGGPVGGR